MFPGYVTMFRDDEGLIHLYFYPGLDESNNLYYRDLDLSNCQVKYNEIINEDASKEYVFENKNIIKIVCRLIDNKGDLHTKELTL